MSTPRVGRSELSTELHPPAVALHRSTGPAVDPRTRVMAGIALAVAAGAAVAPARFLGMFGIVEDDVTGAARFGWRLFATRNVAIATAALRGDRSAEAAFLPVQVLDQIVFWHALARGTAPTRAVVLAASTSGVIVALDLARRRAEQTTGNAEPARAATHPSF